MKKRKSFIIERNYNLSLILLRMKAFEQGLEKKRIKQRNHKFNFSGAEILIAILCL